MTDDTTGAVHPWGNTDEFDDADSPAEPAGGWPDADRAEHSAEASETPTGNENIAEGTVPGTFGGPRQSQGQGQGG